jgi:hypothetical protein
MWAAMDNGHLAILFLCSLLDSYDSIGDQILDGTDSISMDDITSILMSKDLLKKSRLENRGEGEGLVGTMGGPKTMVMMLVVLLIVVEENQRVVLGHVRARMKCVVPIARNSTILSGIVVN